MTKIVIDPNGVVTELVALRMVQQILDREDGTVNFSGGLAVEVKTTKTQKAFKVTLRG